MNRVFNYLTAPAPRYVLRASLISYILKKKIGGHSASRIIEIGPGNGDILAFLSDTYPDATIDAIETSETAALALQKKFSNTSNVNILSKWPRENMHNYDLALCFEVLEHIEDDIGFLLQLGEQLKRNGILLISVPSYMRKWQKQDEWAGHIRRYEKNEFKQKLSVSNFETIITYDYGFPLMDLLQPLKQIYYRKSENISNEEKTKKSGIDRGLIKKANIKYLILLYFPFIWLQYIFLSTNLGDGIIAVTKKR